MIRPLLAAAALALFATSTAYAQDKTQERKPTPQQERMSACSKEAKQKMLKGDERKQFMSECLKAKKDS
jgi:psiF repeat